jgi:hypothetical protein
VFLETREQWRAGITLKNRQALMNPAIA